MSNPMYSNAGFVQMLEIRHGATYPIELVLVQEDGITPYNLTGHEVKASVLSKSDPLYSISFVFAVPGVTGIVPGSLSAAAALTLVANDAQMLVPAYRWVCDIKTPTGEIIPFCHGDVLVRSGGIVWP